MEGPGVGSPRVGAAGGLGTRCPQRNPSMLSPGLLERLELEKKRSRQSLEDSETLRFKEVPHWGASSGLSLPPSVVHPGPADTSAWPGVLKAHPWPGSHRQPWRAAWWFYTSPST